MSSSPKALSKAFKMMLLALFTICFAFVLSACGQPAADTAAPAEEQAQTATTPEPQPAAPEKEKDADKEQAANESGTVKFVDDLGREVEVPANITKIVPSGHTATQVLLTMAPEKLVGLSQELSDSQMKYLDGVQNKDLPVFGAAFGSKGDLNKEAVAAAGGQILIDTGEPKDGIGDDLDALQEQLGIPCVFINTPLDGWDKAYLKLGELLGNEDRAKELADYCANAYKTTTEAMAKIPEADRANMAYLLGDAGLNAIAKTSYQGAVVDMVANNVVVVEKAKGSGMGNEISLEQISKWNPEVIVFAPKSIYGSVKDDPVWSKIAAVENDKVYEVPGKPWNWLNGPPTINQVMGMQWLPRLLYPDAFDDSIEDVTKSYYKTFYQHDLTDEELSELLKNAK
ncbi:MAG: ABC transporter substrate-binding protein [Coriobacteriia bacterium]|nr:ABC transporter substrate-binding protein [Coriobacteriia bacterium]